MRNLAKLILPIVCLFVCISCAENQTDLPISNAADEAQENTDQKRVLAILGDGWHRVAPLDQLLVSGLRRNGWQAVVIMDYDVPWDDFDSYDLIILSREGHEFIQYYRNRDTQPASQQRAYWLTLEQAQKFEDYVNAGGRLFLYHDGFGNYPCDYAMAKLARACFIRHPAIVDITVSPTGLMPVLAEGITPFVVADEEYEVDMDESQTSVFMESHSPEHGRAVQGWAHTYGEGKVAVFVPGHKMDTITHPMVVRTVQNCLDWLTQ